MAKLCDPDIDMIVLPGCTSPEPSIRAIMVSYYAEFLSETEAVQTTDDYINAQNEICQSALSCA